MVIELIVSDAVKYPGASGFTRSIMPIPLGRSSEWSPQYRELSPASRFCDAHKAARGIRFEIKEARNLFGSEVACFIAFVPVCA